MSELSESQEISAGSYEGFTLHQLDTRHGLWEGKLPEGLRRSDSDFERLWKLHSPVFHEIKMHGKTVKTPRWQQAFNRNYAYSGSRNDALRVPDELEPYRVWVRNSIDSRLNGILLNWYDGRSGHYIGRHRDDRRQLIVGSPIVTVSLGETRNFRLRPWKGKGFKDFEANPNTVFIVPWITNLAWTHEVPASAKWKGRRISITFRAFAD